MRTGVCVITRRSILRIDFDTILAKKKGGEEKEIVRRNGKRSKFSYALFHRWKRCTGELVGRLLVTR